MFLYHVCFRMLVCFWHPVVFMMHITWCPWFGCSFVFGLKRTDGESVIWRVIRHPTSCDLHIVMWCHHGIYFYLFGMRNYWFILWHCLCHGVDLSWSTPMCVTSPQMVTKVIVRYSYGNDVEWIKTGRFILTSPQHTPMSINSRRLGYRQISWDWYRSLFLWLPSLYVCLLLFFLFIHVFF